MVLQTPLHPGFRIFVTYPLQSNRLLKLVRKLRWTKTEKRDRLRIDVYSAKERSVDELAWCAFCQEVKPLFWKDSKLFCYEMKFYPKRSRLVVIESCIASMPAYNKSVRVEGLLTYRP